MIQITLQPQQGFLDYLVERSLHSWLGYGGSRGGGKSGGIRRIMLNRRIKHPNTNCLILRRVWDDVSKNHVIKMWEEFPELREYYNTSDKVINLPEKYGGGKMYFDGAETQGDVERKSYGPEFFDVCVDQAEQFSEEELKKLKTICRWPNTPTGTCKFILPFNPGGQGAGFLQRIFYLKEFHDNEKPDDYAFLQAYGWDNVEWSRAALQADGHVGDCLGRACGKCGPCVYYGWSSEVRFQYYITRSQYGQEQNALPPHMRAGQLMGDFKKFAGQYFSNFDEAVVAWDLKDIVFQEHWPVWGSLDWGYQHSAVFLWHTQAGYTNEKGEPKRLVITFRKFITDHLSEGALAEEICAVNGDLKLQNIYGGHDLWSKEDSGETKEEAMSKVFRRHGLPSLKRAVIDRVNGWRFLHRSIDENEWIVTKNCQEVIRAVQNAIFDEKKNNEDILKTKTMYDDVLDCLRYGVYTQFAVKPESDSAKFARQASHLTDITSRNILLMKLNTDRNKKIRNSGWVNSRSQGRVLRYSA